jgi:hypothetical protein
MDLEYYKTQLEVIKSPVVLDEEKEEIQAGK